MMVTVGHGPLLGRPGAGARFCLCQHRRLEPATTLVVLLVRFFALDASLRRIALTMPSGFLPKPLLEAGTQPHSRRKVSLVTGGLLPSATVCQYNSVWRRQLRIRLLAAAPVSLDGFAGRQSL